MNAKFYFTISKGSAKTEIYHGKGNYDCASPEDITILKNFILIHNYFMNSTKIIPISKVSAFLSIWQTA